MQRKDCVNGWCIINIQNCCGDCLGVGQTWSTVICDLDIEVEGGVSFKIDGCAYFDLDLRTNNLYKVVIGIIGSITCDEGIEKKVPASGSAAERVPMSVPAALFSSMPVEVKARSVGAFATPSST